MWDQAARAIMMGWPEMFVINSCRLGSQNGHLVQAFKLKVLNYLA